MIRKFYDLMYDDCVGSTDPVVKDFDIEKQAVIECECGAHMLKVFSLCHVYEMESGKQRINQSFDLAMFSYGSNKRRFWDRVKIAFKYLWGGKMFRDQLCLNADEAKKLSDFINNSIVPTEHPHLLTNQKGG